MAPLELVTRRNVELVKTGEHKAVTGPANITMEKIKSMVDASHADWYDSARMRTGHFRKELSAEDQLKAAMGTVKPAVGKIENLRVIGNSLYGDFVDMPPKLADVLAHAYPGRSIEWVDDFEAPDGKTYPAVLRGVALLGDTQPGVAGLAPIPEIESLDDVYDLYAASSGQELKTNSALIKSNSETNSDDIDKNDQSIRAQQPEIVQDQNTVEVSNNSLSSQTGEPDMTDTLSEQLRAKLKLAADADVEAEVDRLLALAEKAEGSNKQDEKEPETPAPVVPQPAPVEQPKPVDEPKPQETATAVTLEDVTTTVPKEWVDQFAVLRTELNSLKAERNEKEVEKELLTLSGRYAPAQYETYKSLMLKSEDSANAVRQMLSGAPVLFSTVTTTAGSTATGPASKDDLVSQIADNIFRNGESL